MRHWTSNNELKTKIRNVSSNSNLDKKANKVKNKSFDMMSKNKQRKQKTKKKQTRETTDVFKICTKCVINYH